MAPNSKHPFLNMKTLVLLMHVPGKREKEREKEREREREGERERETRIDNEKREGSLNIKKRKERFIIMSVF